MGVINVCDLHYSGGSSNILIVCKAYINLLPFGPTIGHPALHPLQFV